jgi:hypothetical protein
MFKLLSQPLPFSDVLLDGYVMGYLSANIDDRRDNGKLDILGTIATAINKLPPP